MKRILEEIIDRNTEGNYLLSSSCKAQMISEILDLLGVSRSFPVEQFRQKLFSMRSTKDAMDKLSEADRLMMYGYHDCINEMLMWAQPYRK